MLAGIPALAGQVDTAAEGDRIVNDDELLMMRRADRLRTVLTEMNTTPRFPTETI